MNKTDDGKLTLKGNNESFQYLGSISPEEEIRLAEERKRKSKKRTRLIAGILAGGTLIGTITASYLKNNALVSPYSSEVGKDLFATPEYKELYKEYRDQKKDDLEWSEASCCLPGYYTKDWGMTEEEAIKYTIVDSIFFTKDKIYVYTAMVKGFKSELHIYSCLEYDLDEQVIKDLLSLKNTDATQFNLLMQHISKSYTPKVLSQFYHSKPLIMIDVEEGADSAECFYNFDKGYLSGYAFRELLGKVTMYHVKSDNANILTKDENGVYPNTVSVRPYCQIIEEGDEIIGYYNDSINLSRHSREMGLTT